MFTFFFPRIKKTHFWFNNIIGRLFPIKWKIKKTKAKIITKPIKKRTKKLLEYYNNLSEDEKTKKRIYANIRTKTLTDIEKEKKEYNINSQHKIFEFFFQNIYRNSKHLKKSF